MHRPKPKGRPFKVADPGRVAGLIQEVVNQQFGGNLSKAAKSIGMVQSQLFRLSNRESLRIREATLLRLARLIPSDRRKDLARALFSPEALLALQRYKVWLRQSTRTRLGIPASAGATREANRRARSGIQQYGGLVRFLRRRFSAMLDAFLSDMQEQGHSPDRIRMAAERVLEPLADSKRSGRIERRRTELSETELRRFLKAGFDRERIMLNRSPDEQRAQEVEKAIQTDVSRDLLASMGYGNS